mgnify:CR=1 FL=1
MNYAGIALIQLALAPAAAAWYRQPLIAELLQVQALIYLATPFIALVMASYIRLADYSEEGGFEAARELLVKLQPRETPDYELDLTRMRPPGLTEVMKGVAVSSRCRLFIQ